MVRFKNVWEIFIHNALWTMPERPVVKRPGATKAHKERNKTLQAATHKICSTCKKKKPIGDFSLRSGGMTRRAQCKKCRYNRHMKTSKKQ